MPFRLARRLRDAPRDGGDKGDERGGDEVGDVGPGGGTCADGRASEPADEKRGDG